MEDPKRQAWMYLIAGVVAIAAAVYFLSTDTDTGTAGNFSLLDWAILGMGVVAIYRGAKGFIDLRRGDAEPRNPSSGTTPPGPRKIARPDSSHGRAGP